MNGEAKVGQRDASPVFLGHSRLMTSLMTLYNRVCVPISLKSPCSSSPLPFLIRLAWKISLYICRVSLFKDVEEGLLLVRKLIPAGCPIT